VTSFDPEPSVTPRNQCARNEKGRVTSPISCRDDERFLGPAALRPLTRIPRPPLSFEVPPHCPRGDCALALVSRHTIRSAEL